MLNLRKWENPEHRRQDGLCCENGIEPDGVKDNKAAICTLECDNVFRIRVVSVCND